MNTATRILLIEDDPDDYLLTADLFAELGDSQYQLKWVDNYDAGVERLLQDPPDLCLLDYNLGARNGLDLLQTVTAHGCTVPIVFLTGQTERRLDEEAMTAGAAGYLIKGQLGPHPLERTIRYAIESNRSAAASRARERLRAAERLTSAIESIPQAFALFDADDLLIQCNGAYHRLLGGVHPGQLIGRPYPEILALWSSTLVFADEAERARQCVEWLIRRRQREATLEVRTRDDRKLRTWARTTPWGGVVELLFDITEDARREDDLLRARRLADEGNSAKSYFLASVSHELRTPLNAILGFSQLLQRDRTPLDPVHREWVQQIHMSGEHLLRLIDDILDLSRLDGKNFALSLRPVRLSEVLRKVGDMIGPMASSLALAVSVPEIDEPLDGVTADGVRLTQVLMNFASNAVKYNVTGGRVAFSVHAPEAGRVRVTVEDTGVGIPSTRQHEVFQPFQRAGQETGTITGTGMGLAITKRLAELMDGAVGFVSVPGRGSSFWIDLPAAAAPGRPAAPTSEVAGGAANVGEGERKLVLCVEDNPANMLFLTALLASFGGVETLAATTAEEGLALALARRPAVILMDIDLPDMTGFEALLRLRAHPETHDIPAVALSAAAFDGDRERGERAGFFRYLTKPVDIDELNTTLVRLGLLRG